MDWSRCQDVESKPDVLSGVPVVKGTRVQADALIINARDGFSPEEIVTELFPTVPLNRARRIIEFAKQLEPRSA